MGVANYNTHPIQSGAYSTVLGIILFIIFVIVFILILYFVFGDCILNNYCFITNSTSCFCPNAPECCNYEPGIPGSCEFIRNKDEAIRKYCVDNPCDEICIENYEAPFKTILSKIEGQEACPAPDGIEVEQGTKSLAHLCAFTDICENFQDKTSTTICGVPFDNVCTTNLPTIHPPPIEPTPPLLPPIPIDQSFFPVCYT